MTEHGEAGQGPRIEAWHFVGAAALSVEDYAALQNDLDAVAARYGLVRQPMAPTSVVGLLREAGQISLDGPADAETETLPTLLTCSSMEEFAEEQEITEPSFGRNTWTAVYRVSQEIVRAREELAAGGIERRLGEPEKSVQGRHFLASLDLRVVEGTRGDEYGRMAIDMPSLYRTLRVVLKNGFPTEKSPLPRLGVKRLSFLAELVNARLEPTEPLPVYEEVILEPLPPRYPRAVNIDSPFVLRAWRGQEMAGVVSRAEMVDFAVSRGLPAAQTTHFLQMFEQMARHLNRTLMRPGRTNQQQWVGGKDVFFVGIRRVEGGFDRSIWGIELNRFIDLVYELEERPELRQKIHGVGLPVRQLFRQYLEEVAPHLPSHE